MVDIKLENLNFRYPQSNCDSLSGINLEIKSGEFVVVCGPSGSGKSTLLRMLKPELTPEGKTEGKITLFGKDKNELSARESAQKIGFLLQDPEYQTATYTVRSELSFGLENLGLKSDVIRLKTAEIAAYFSLDRMLDKKVSELSGGSKQLLCLAGIAAMQPKILILDEPTSQLDPTAAENLLKTAEKLCKENGITVILTEHRLESVINYADRLIILDSGKIAENCRPEIIRKELFEANTFVKNSMPSPMRLHFSLGIDAPAPLSVAAARSELSVYLKNKTIALENPQKKPPNTSNIALKAKGVKFAYDKSGYVLKGLDLSVAQGSFFAVLGANAAGKSTAVSLLSGLTKCKDGKIELFGKNIKKYSDSELFGKTVGVLPQKRESLFGSNSVREDLEFVLSGLGMSKAERFAEIEKTADFFEISHLLDRHPYDISGGEMQRAALAAVMLRKPKILFLDEPTKGMDNTFKLKFAEKMKDLCRNGVTVVAVSHDIEFCAEHCDECAMIFDGRWALQAPSNEFFAGNYFYTTAANKIARDFFPNAVTERQVAELCRKSK